MLPLGALQSLAPHRRRIHQPMQDDTMNQDRIEGNWMQLKGKIKQQWGKLTDDDLDVMSGKKDELLGKIQERQGITKDEAEKQLSAWQKNNP